METINGPVGERIHTYLGRITPFGFSGSVLVSIKGEVVLNHGYGVANRATGEPNRAETVFNLGSITKQFTAAAILLLEMQGRLSTHDSISRFFPQIPTEKQAVTLHHLLTHTAEMPLYTGEDYEAAGREETVQKILEAPLEFAPGSAYRYSNAGYSLLAALIELVSGSPYEQFLSEQLFGPAGLVSTGYRLPAWEARRLARGYVAGQDLGVPPEKNYPSWNVMGNGEMLSTTSDLYRWHMALKSDRPLSAAARQKLWTPFLQDYAYGWVVRETEYGPVREHNGAGDTGMSADLKWYTDPDILVVLFGNQTLTGGLLPITVVDKKISALVFDRPVALPPPLPAQPGFSPIMETSGDYHLDNGASFTLRRQPDGLVLHPRNQAAIHLIWDPIPEAAGLNQRVEKAFGSLVEGDRRALDDELGSPERAERYQKYLDSALLEGSLDREWEVAGTVPSGDGRRPVTLMSIRAGKAQAALEVYWEQDKLYGLRLLENLHPLGIPLRPASEQQWIGCDLGTGQVIEVTLQGGALAVKRLG